MVTRAIRRTRKTAIQNEKDFYQTHPLMVAALVWWFKETQDKTENLKVLDPCSGKNVIYRGLLKHFINVTKFDKFSGFPRRNFLTHNKKYDIIICNPPYSAKYKFINHARELATHVFVLLPLNISNYNMFHDNYQDIPEFVGKIVMTPKMFLSQSTEFKPGGTSAYAWYYWSSDNSTKGSREWYYNLRSFM